MVGLPEHINAAFATRYNARDVDGLLALYEPTASVVNRDGSVSTGADRIREHLEALVGIGGSMTSENTYAIVNGDVALVGAAWTITLDAGPVITGSTAEVLRKGRDGSWRYVIDHPHTASL